MLQVKSCLSILFKHSQLSVLILALQGWPSQAMALDVRGELAGFFQAYLGRSLTERELNDAVIDYQSFFGNPGHCNAECEKALESHKANRSYFAQNPDTPKELMLRHAYLTNAVFEPRNQGGIILCLLAEPDPVAAIDYIKKRVMTKRDLEALQILLTLPESGKPGAPPKLSRAQFAKSKYELAAIFNNNSDNKLPILYAIAAELYTGIARDWANLSEADRAVTLEFLKDKGVGQSLPTRLYQQFLGVNAQDAERIAIKQAREALDKTFALSRKLIELQSRAKLIEQLGTFSENPGMSPR